MFCTLNAYAADTVPDYSKGPLSGKNLFIPLLLQYNFLALPAKSGKQYDFQYHLSLYYIQDVYYMAEDYKPERFYEKKYIIRDYESCVAELGFAYNIRDYLQIGMEMRLFSYYGGFLDSMIESFHGFLGTENAHRDHFLQNQIYINIPTDNNIGIFLDRSATSFGDIDLWCKQTLYETGSLSIGALGAFKLPTGSLAALSGSGYPDAALGLLLDFRATRYMALYTQAGLVMPFTGKFYTMFNGMIGLELHPWKLFSINIQTNIKTSPISDYSIDYLRNESLATNFKKYTPQINLLAGLVFQYKNFRFQFYFEEDAFIIYQGTDITFNMMISHTFNLKNLNRRKPEYSI